MLFDRSRLLSGVLTVALLVLPAQPSVAALNAVDRLAGLRGSTMDRVIVLYQPSAIDVSAFTESVRNLGGSLTHSFATLPAIAVRLSPGQRAALAKVPGVQRIVDDLPMHIFLAQSVPQINADDVQALGFRGAGVRACIVDTGVAPHSALPALVAQADMVADDGNANDGNGHGTHVAGIIHGVAPDASLMAARVLDDNGSGYTSDVIAGIEWCVQQNADIINLSLGGGSFTTTCDDQPVSQAVNNAVTAGVTVFAASGNDGRSDRIASPGCASKAIAVGSVNKDDTRASYSNGGTELDIMAPGTSIRSTYLSNSFEVLSGTSMATPHAAGAAALLLSQVSTLSPQQIRSVMQSTAVDLGAAGFDKAFGYGRINTLAASQSLSGPLPPPPPPPSSSILFSDAFTDLGKWQQSGGGRWIATTPAERVIPGTGTDNTVAHGDGCKGGCTLTVANPVNLAGVAAATLRFWRYVDSSIDPAQSGAPDEYLRLEVSNGGAWRVLKEWKEGDGDDDTWHQDSFPLQTSDLTSNFKMRFVTLENSAFEEGEVDDIVVEAQFSSASNVSPTAAAGSDQLLRDNDNNGSQTATLNGASSSDPDGSIAAYEWKEGSTVLGTTASITPTFSVGTHTVTLTVTDDDGATGSDTVVVIVLPNATPVANAGADRTVTDGDGDGTVSVQLDGSVSADPDGTIAAYAWAEGAVALGTTAKLTLPALALGTHTFTLTVTDNAGVSASDSVIITVTDNAAPVANASDVTVGDSDGDGSQQVTLNGSASADSDGSITAYEWKEGAAVLGTTAAISPILTVGVHAIALTVTDNSGLTGSKTVTATVQANKVPTVNAGADVTVNDTDGNGSQQVTLQGTGADQDGSIASYAWTEGATVLGSTASISPTLAVGVHTLTLTVTDNGGATGSDTVIVNVEQKALPTSILIDDFQGDLSKWSQQTAGVWTIVSAGGSLRASAGRCGGGACALTTIPSFDLTGYSSVSLSFDRFVDFFFSNDSLTIEGFDGQNWVQLLRIDRNSANQRQWKSHAITLPASFLRSGIQFRATTNNLFGRAVQIDTVKLNGSL